MTYTSATFGRGGTDTNPWGSGEQDPVARSCQQEFIDYTSGLRTEVSFNLPPSCEQHSARRQRAAEDVSARIRSLNWMARFGSVERVGDTVNFDQAVCARVGRTLCPSGTRAGRGDPSGSCCRAGAYTETSAAPTTWLASPKCPVGAEVPLCPWSSAEDARHFLELSYERTLQPRRQILSESEDLAHIRPC